jgi:large subunit ribosomal protein L35
MKIDMLYSGSGAPAGCHSFVCGPAGPCPRLHENMPKLKTHKGASKRFKKTGTGKIARRHAFARHILTSKPRSRKRRLTQGVVADETDQQKLRTMLPY